MSKKVWMMSAIVVIVLSVSLGIFVSESSLLSVLGEPVETEQIEVSESPWTQEGSLFTTQVAYVSPAGDETNTITLGVENNVITSFDMTVDTTNEASQFYQEKFITEMKTFVIGKTVAEITQIDAIAGASNTTDAFKAAVAEL